MTIIDFILFLLILLAIGGFFAVSKFWILLALVVVLVYAFRR